MKKPSLNNLFAFILPLVVSIFLQFLPLTNTTGFEYSFVMSLPLFFSGGLIAFEKKRSDKHNYFTTSIIIISVPFIISLFTNIFFSPCPLSFDLVFYFVIAVPAFFIGYVIGEMILGCCKILQRTFLLILLILLLLISLGEFYFYPQIYFYNPVFGYFPGTIYDEHIELSGMLIAYRLLSILFFGIIYVLLKKLNCTKHKIYLGVLVAAIVWFGFAKQSLGFITTEGELQSELNNKISSEHFEIYFSDEAFFDKNSLKNLHEFYYEKIKSVLKLKNDIEIRSYIFDSKSQKKELFGSENADVAKPWLKQIYLDKNNFQNSLKHELVHVMAGEFGNKPFKVAGYINPALIEGVAMAIEDEYAGAEIDYFVQLAIQSGYQVNVAELFTGLNFFTNASSASYLFAGSFIKYLLNNSDLEKVKKLYSSGCYRSTYETKLSEMEVRFERYIKNLDYDINKETAQLYFSYKPLIKKICPRYAARLQKKADNIFSEGRFNEAYEIYNNIFEYSNTYPALAGMINAKILLGDYQEAKKIVEENFNNFKNTSYFYNLELWASDTAILNSDSAEAILFIDSLLIQKPSMGYYTAASLRKGLLKKSSHIYKEYLLSNRSQKFEILLNLYLKEKEEILIPRLVQYGRGLDRLKELIGNINLSALHENELGVYIAQILANENFMLNSLEEAKKYSEFCMEHNSKAQLQNILKEQFSLINWSISKSSESLK